MVIFLEIAEKERVKQRYPNSKANIRLVQHCAAISAKAELLYKFCMQNKKRNDFEVLKNIIEMIFWNEQVT